METPAKKISFENLLAENTETRNQNSFFGMQHLSSKKIEIVNYEKIFEELEKYLKIIFDKITKDEKHNFQNFSIQKKGNYLQINFSQKEYLYSFSEKNFLGNLNISEKKFLLQKLVEIINSVDLSKNRTLQIILDTAETVQQNFLELCN